LITVIDSAPARSRSSGAPRGTRQRRNLATQDRRRQSVLLKKTEGAV
jgi:hypothetical protein